MPESRLIHVDKRGHNIWEFRMEWVAARYSELAKYTKAVTVETENGKVFPYWLWFYRAFIPLGDVNARLDQ